MGFCRLSWLCPSPCSSWSSFIILGQERRGKLLQVSSFLRQCGRGCGFRLVIALMSKDLASSKSRIIASYVCLSKPMDLDIPSPLITSSHLVAANQKAKLGTSSFCKQPNSFLWLRCLQVSESTWPFCSGRCILQGSSQDGEKQAALGGHTHKWHQPVQGCESHSQLKAGMGASKSSPVTDRLFLGGPGSERWCHFSWCNLWQGCWVSPPRFWKP